MCGGTGSGVKEKLEKWSEMGLYIQQPRILRFMSCFGFL